MKYIEKQGKQVEVYLNLRFRCFGLERGIFLEPLILKDRSIMGNTRKDSSLFVVEVLIVWFIK